MAGLGRVSRGWFWSAGRGKVRLLNMTAFGFDILLLLQERPPGIGPPPV